MTLAMTLRQAASLAGVSWSTAARVELGDPNASLDTLCAVAGAVGLDTVVRTYPGTPPTLRDTGQLALVERLCREAHAVWQPHVELLIGQHGESIDLVLLGSQEIWATEIERMATDFQAQYRRADRKREALGALHRRPVRLVMVVEDTRRNRSAVEAHLAFMRSVLPAGTRQVLNALRRGTPLGEDGLAWIRRATGGSA